MKILIAGDFCITNRAEMLVRKRDFSFLDHLKEVSKLADFAIANFEGPIASDEDNPIIKCGPNLNMPKESAEAFAYAGFNIATLANNHVLDYGVGGLNHTVKLLESNNIKTVGIGRDIESASQPLLISLSNQKVAIINCCEHEFSLATDNSAGANPIDPVKLFYDINDAKQKADKVIVIAHGGHEHYNLPSLRMQNLYRYLIDRGADMVVNHHQHCFSGFEQYNGKMIFYGLGNLCFDRLGKSNEPWNRGYAILLSVEDEISYTIIPYDQFSDNPEILILKQGFYDKEIENLNRIISDRALLKEYQEKYFNETSKYFRNRFEPFNNRIISSLRSRGFFPYLIGRERMAMIENISLCESHKEKLEHMFVKVRNNN